MVAVGAGVGAFALACGVGWVNVGAAAELLSGHRVTAATAFALVATLCWIAIAALLSRMAAGLARAHAEPHRGHTSLTALMLLGAAIVLALGLARHSQSFGVCCATPASAAQADAHAH